MTKSSRDKRHLFISYAAKDSSTEALALSDALEALGFVCWIAPRDVRVGLPYPRQIVEAIENCIGVAAIVSPSANESSHVLQEVELAASFRKIIVPVVLRSTVASPDLRYYFGVRHQATWVDAVTTAKTLKATFHAATYESSPGGGQGDVFCDGAGLPQLVAVPPGQFRIGSPPGEIGREDTEGPQREVRIGYEFALGRFPVTVEQFGAFVLETNRDLGDVAYVFRDGAPLLTQGKNWRDAGFSQTGSHPVCCVNWYDAIAYVGWLNTLVGSEAYRLPSESEWEYACRAGTSTRYSTGVSITRDQACFSASSWGDAGGTTPVGSFPPNAFGLYDMHGNIDEWVQDCFVGTYVDLPSDGASVELGNSRNRGERCTRGGSWDCFSLYLRSASRRARSAESRSSSVGFRVARSMGDAVR